MIIKIGFQFLEIDFRESAKGGGTIRRKTVTRNGREYTYWEARITTGRDPGTGRQVQRSITGKTQKEVREKLTQAVAAIDTGTYITPQKMTVGQWLDAWQKDYLVNVKIGTLSTYDRNIRNHIKPALGAIRLTDLQPQIIQRFINSLQFAPSTIQLNYRILHCALEKAVELDYIIRNPADRCTLPRMEQTEIHPLDDQQVAALLKAAAGASLEQLIRIALFTGLRESELLGLTWDCIDFDKNTIAVTKQLTRTVHRSAGLFISPKSGKSRTITAAASVMQALRNQKLRLTEMQLRAGPMWDNAHNLVFTTETGGPMNHQSMLNSFGKILKAAGLEGIHFHDTRHTYAVNALRAGDDVKSVQGNLGHSRAAFTLDRYGHFTEQMKQDSAARMEGFIKNVLNL